MKMDRGSSFLGTGPDQSDQDTFVLSMGFEAGITTKATAIELFGKVDCYFAFVGNRVHGHRRNPLPLIVLRTMNILDPGTLRQLRADRKH